MLKKNYAILRQRGGETENELEEEGKQNDANTIFTYLILKVKKEENLPS